MIGYSHDAIRRAAAMLAHEASVTRASSPIGPVASTSALVTW